MIQRIDTGINWDVPLLNNHIDKSLVQRAEGFVKQPCNSWNSELGFRARHLESGAGSNLGSSIASSWPSCCFTFTAFISVSEHHRAAMRGMWQVPLKAFGTELDSEQPMTLALIIFCNCSPVTQSAEHWCPGKAKSCPAQCMENHYSLGSWGGLSMGGDLGIRTHFLLEGGLWLNPRKSHREVHKIFGKLQFFFWQYWELNLRPHGCLAGALSLELLHQPFLHWLFLR